MDETSGNRFAVLEDFRENMIEGELGMEAEVGGKCI